MLDAIRAVKTYGKLCLHTPDRTHTPSSAKIMEAHMLPDSDIQTRIFIGAINDMLIWPFFTLNLKNIPQKSIQNVISYGMKALRKDF